MDDLLNSVQEVPRDLKCWPKILAIYVVGDVSIRLHILTQEFKQSRASSNFS